MRFVGIDPSTKTGFVALDLNGEVLRAKELTGIGSVDPKRMLTLVNEVIAHVRKGDFIVIEGFGYNTTQGVQLGGIGWGIRMELERRGIKYIEASPSQLKKFASGKGNTPKDLLAVHIYKNFNFEHSSDNVRDAYVLAQIAANLFFTQETQAIVAPKYQLEVIDAILNPKPKEKKKRKKKVAAK